MAALSFYMEVQYIIAIVWLKGFVLSYWMLTVEHESEDKVWTHGDKTLMVLLSMFSFAMVLLMLIKAWAASVNAYWSKPVKTKKAE
jgi:hypothetical protein